jgi:hypothetical protein
VTTQPVAENIPCTICDGLNIQDIGAISMHAKYIIAINSGPVAAIFNKTAAENVKKWIILDKGPYTFLTINYVMIPNNESIDNIEQYLD